MAVQKRLAVQKTNKKQKNFNSWPNSHQWHLCPCCLRVRQVMWADFLGLTSKSWQGSQTDLVLCSKSHLLPPTKHEIRPIYSKPKSLTLSFCFDFRPVGQNLFWKKVSMGGKKVSMKLFHSVMKFSEYHFHLSCLRFCAHLVCYCQMLWVCFSPRLAYNTCSELVQFTYCLRETDEYNFTT